MIECNRPERCRAQAGLTTSNSVRSSTVAEANSTPQNVDCPIVSKQRREMTPMEYKAKREQELRWYYKNKNEVLKKRRAYYAANKEKIIAKRKQYERENRDHIQKREDKYRIKRLYGIPIEEYKRLLFLQGGKCAICGSKGGGAKNKRRLGVDHCHSAGKVRGLLCSMCNTGIGHFNDNPELLRKAADYLEISK